MGSSTISYICTSAFAFVWAFPWPSAWHFSRSHTKIEKSLVCYARVTAKIPTWALRLLFDIYVRPPFPFAFVSAFPFHLQCLAMLRYCCFICMFASGISEMSCWSKPTISAVQPKNQAANTKQFGIEMNETISIFIDVNNMWAHAVNNISLLMAVA